MEHGKPTPGSFDASIPEVVLNILKSQKASRFDFQAAVERLSPEELRILASLLLNRPRGGR
jgi:hypothetical protein